MNPSWGPTRPDEQPIFELLTTPGSPLELRGEAAAVRDFRGQHRPRRATWSPARLAAVASSGVIVPVVILSFAVTAAAAYTARLPQPLQRLAHQVFGVIWVPPPSALQNPLATAGASRSGAAQGGTSAGSTRGAARPTGASAAATQSALATALTVTASRTVITAGEPDSIRGVLRDHLGPVAGQPVILYVETYGSRTWTRAGSGYTDTHGVANLTLAPQPRNGQVLLVHPASPRYGASTSRSVPIGLVPRLVATLAETTTAVGAEVALDTSISPDLSGETVVLQRLVSGRWDTLATTQLSHGEPARFEVGADRAQTLTLRVWIAATAAHLSATSETVTLTVR